MILSEHSVKGITTEVTICPLGDIQWAGRKSDVAFDHLQAHISRCLKHPNPLFVGMGDYIDFASPSNREAFRTSRLYDTARRVIDDKALDLTVEAYKLILEPTKGKWLGLLSGHHYFPLQTGGNTDMKLAEMLDAPYLGNCALIQIMFREPTHRFPLRVWAHHGCGGSVFPHGPLVKLYRVAPHWDADVFLMGHQPKKAVGEFDYIEPIFPSRGEPRLAHRTRHLVGTGGWAKGYQEGDKEGTYVEKGMMGPVSLGQPLVHVRPSRRRQGGSGIWEPNVSVEV